MSGYAYSIWAFPIGRFRMIMREYFRFCREYYTRAGFRCDLPNVGYAVRQDRSALFSYSREADCLRSIQSPRHPGPMGTHSLLLTIVFVANTAVSRS